MPAPPTTSRQAAAAALADIAPILVGVVPFGVIYGIVAVAQGLPELPALLMSSAVFAGASQIAAVELLGGGAPLAIVVLTAWVINLRFTMYSAAIAPWLQREPMRWRWLHSYILTDQGFAVSMVRFADLEPSLRRSYYLSCSLALWCTWQLSSATGIFVGSAIPASWSLDFAVPLTFLALLFPSIRGRGDALAAVVATVVALLATQLPLRLGLLVAAAAGIAAGAIFGGDDA